MAHPGHRPPGYGRPRSPRRGPRSPRQDRELRGVLHPRTDAIHRASAGAAFSSILLAQFPESGEPAVPSLIQDMLLRFKLTNYSVFNTNGVESGGEAEPQANAPTVHYGEGSDRGRTVLHFISESEQALLVLTADRPRSEGRCPPDFDSKHTRPPEIVRQFFRPELS